MFTRKSAHSLYRASSRVNNRFVLTSNNWSSLSAERSNLLRFYATLHKVPDMGDSITEGTISKIHKKIGDFIKADETVYSIETDKITAEVPMPTNGVVTKFIGQVGETVEVGKPLFEYDENGKPSANSEETSSSSETSTNSDSSSSKSETKGSSEAPKKEETKSAPKESAKEPQKEEAPSLQQSDDSKGEKRVPMTRMRTKIAQRLKESQNTYALLTTFNEIDMTNLLNLRQKYKAAFQEKHGVKLGFMGMFLKASAMALQAVPSVNAVIDGNEIVYRDYVDIGVAVATPRGLVVPIVRNVESMSLAEIELEILRLAQKARDGKITLGDMAGGTFTISNGGVYGSMMGTPIVNPPQSAILGMHATKERAVVKDGKVTIAPMMYSALTYDHRLIDGREAVTCLKMIGDLVGDPERMLLQ